MSPIGYDVDDRDRHRRLKLVPPKETIRLLRKEIASLLRNVMKFFETFDRYDWQWMIFFMVSAAVTTGLVLLCRNAN